MANGLNSIIKRQLEPKPRGDTTKMGSRRIFTPQFKLQVLDSYRQDADCKGNQRATARKYGIHRRQIQKWLQVENNLRTTVSKNGQVCSVNGVNENSRRMTLDSGRQGDAVLGAYTSVIYSESGMCDSWKLSPLAPNTPPSSPTSTTLCSLNVNKGAAAQALDFSTHDRNKLCDSETSSVSEAAKCFVNHEPIDLSFKKPLLDMNDITSIPVSTQTCGFESQFCLPTLHTPPQDQDLEVWDLSCRKRKYYDHFTYSPTTGYFVNEPIPSVAVNTWSNTCDKQCSPKSEVSSTSENTVRTCASDGPPPNKTVKLFKPYLLSDERDEKAKARTPTHIQTIHTTADNMAATIYSRNSSHDSDITSLNTTCDKDAYLWNTSISNNNNLYTYNYEYYNEAIVRYRYHSTTPYTINNSDMNWQSVRPIHSPTYDSVRSLSPSEDDSASLSLSMTVPIYKTMECDTSGLISTSVRQRQSYSVGFKLSAIDSYYHDMTCRGNQRAVANKYNIHRRQIQKWLKQEDLLRQKIHLSVS